MTRRSEHLSQALHDYVEAHSTQPDQVLRELAAETENRFGADAGMQIGPDQGTFMTMLARLIGASRAVEVGTFTGYSAICIARGLAPGGRLVVPVGKYFQTLTRIRRSPKGFKTEKLLPVRFVPMTGEAEK